jgi:hypothetical protein
MIYHIYATIRIMMRNQITKKLSGSYILWEMDLVAPNHDGNKYYTWKSIPSFYKENWGKYLIERMILVKPKYMWWNHGANLQNYRQHVNSSIYCTVNKSYLVDNINILWRESNNFHGQLLKQHNTGKNLIASVGKKTES